MAASRKELPDTMISPGAAEALHRGVRPFTVVYKGKSATVELPGYYPENGDDGVHVGDDMAVSDAALRALKEDNEGVPTTYDDQAGAREAQAVTARGRRPAQGRGKRLRQV